jgi:carbon monoxide dehydrogenase subunit G
MRLEKEFIVAAPLERVWLAVSDAGIFASSIPGGELRAIDDIYAGQFEFAADGPRVLCETTVRSVDCDEDEHVATILLHARQLGGPGIGSATIRSRCEAAGGETRVLLSAEVRSGGHEAGAQALESAARKILDKTTETLGERAAATLSSVTSLPTGAGRPASPAAGAEASSGSSSDGTPARKALQRRTALAAGSLVTVLLMRKLLARRRPGHS